MAHELEQVAAYSDFQNEIYAAGQAPPFPVAWRALEAAGSAAMTPEAADYVAGGAGGEETVRANREAFDRFRIVPRMLREVGARNLAMTILDTRLPAPLLLGPVGVQQIIHDDAEVATARAAASLGVPYVHSTAASTGIEGAAGGGGAGPRWFQLYFPRHRDIAASFVRRAEAAGYEAVVVTLDTLILGCRPRDLGRAYLPFLKGIGLANYTSDHAFTARLQGDSLETTVAAWIETFANPDLSWADIAWLAEQTDLPLLVKGVNTAEDARRALDAGVRGVIVSNHGGRQVDGAIAALDALPEVVAAVAPEVPVLFDSGIRTGADAVKALARGARAVLVARPVMWGLALGGEAGVAHVLRTLLGELDNTLAMSGHRSHRELAAGSLRPRP